MKIWKVKEERLGAKILRLQKRLENIVNNKLIPSSLKSKMVMNLKEKINECEVEAGIAKGNREVEALNKIEKELMKKLDTALDKETEESILEELEFVLEEENAKRNEILSEAREKYSQNKSHIDRMRKIRGHKSPGKIKMDEIKEGRSQSSTDTYSRYNRENINTEGMQSEYRNLETTRPSYEGQRTRETFEDSKTRDTATKREEIGNPENKPNRKKHYNKKERLEKLVEIAKANGISYEEWESEIAKGRAEEKCEGIRKSISEVDELIVSLKREINKEERNKIEAETKIGNLTTELNDVQAFKNRAEKRAQKSKDELDKSAEEEKQKEIEDANKKVEEASKKIERVQGELKTTNAAKEASTKKIEELKKEFEAAQKLREELGEQYSVAKQELDEIVNSSSKDELPKYEEVPLVTKQRENRDVRTEQEIDPFEEEQTQVNPLETAKAENGIGQEETSKENGEDVRANLHKLIEDGVITKDDLAAVIRMVEQSKNIRENGQAPTKQKVDRESVGE